MKHRAQRLRNLGRREEYLALERELATNGEWDLSAQTQYANTLANAGEFTTAYEWARSRDRNRRRTRCLRIRSAVLNVLLAAQLAGPVFRACHPDPPAGSKKTPASYDGCQRYLGALIYADRTAEADAKCLEWLTASRVEGELSQAMRQQLGLQP